MSDVEQRLDSSRVDDCGDVEVVKQEGSPAAAAAATI
jgi:hypothetical protein